MMTMKAGFARRLTFAFVLFSLAAAGNGSAEDKKNPAVWSQKMQGLASTLSDLLIDLSSDERYNSPKNFKRIERNAEKLARLAHSLKMEAANIPDQDPSVRLMGSLFGEEADQAVKTLKQGNRVYARDLLRSMTGYCMACHTRSGGPGFANFGTNPKLDGLKALEKAEYFAATRQFDRAIEDYEQILSSQEKSAGYSIEWERAMRAALAIAVRVKNDPDRSLQIVERAIAAPKAPYFLKKQAAQWKESILQWKAERPRTAQTEEGYYAEAVRLIAEAKAGQKYPSDRSADVQYLRASRALHDQLSMAPSGRHSTEAVYLAGLCYEVLDGLNLWDLHEFYFQACIQKEPHSAVAQQCYRHYEESVYAGYTGSGGTFLPEDVRKKLNRLELLSNPAGSPKDKVKLQ